MVRFVAAFCLFSLLLSSVGCRLCCSPYDYCISAQIDRPDDFRGCGPFYRAGSILSGGHGMCQVSAGEVIYVGNAGEFYGNAGSYGITSPVVTPTVRPTPDYTESTSIQEQGVIIGKPQENGSSNGKIPSVEHLLQQPRRSTIPDPMLPVPITPPPKPRIDTDEMPNDAEPFSPNDEILPQPMLPNPFPITTDEDTPITLEELRRLDPSVRDIQIISIEDASTGKVLY